MEQGISTYSSCISTAILLFIPLVLIEVQELWMHLCACESMLNWNGVHFFLKQVSYLIISKQQHDEEITTTTVATDQSTGEEQQKTRDYCTFFFREDQQRRTAGQHEHELHRQACSVGERARTRAWVILQWQRRRFLVTGGATDELQWQQAADHHGQENQQPIDRGKVTWRTRRSP
ncbi:hypothetical protein CFC21_002834 [Triticum aestivum]|uniref:Uncharacterized protein n=1 Tax=Triticum aestivum TaxID=4565 RepID=A0A3B5Y2H6_WHEAT|nr:uncharacterized protein LOC123057289 [Triticum aestivum]KAF6984891.1 hypothetical protein CFC21_002834 [Triticum aestivum]